MTLAVLMDFRFRGTPDGSVWTKTTYAAPFWQRYLAVFEAVNVVARVEPQPGVPGDWRRVDGEGVRVTHVPYYLGPAWYLRRQSAVKRVVRGAFRIGDAVLIRALSQVGSVLVPKLSRMAYPFGLEVCGDPYDAFSPGAVRHPLRPIFRCWFARTLRRQCRQAQAVAYVTESALQRRYPCSEYSIGASDVDLPDDSLAPVPRVFTTFYSNVELQEDAFATTPAGGAARNGATLAFVGSLAQMYKGPDILLQGVQRLNARGLRVSAVLIGDGQHRRELESYAQGLGISGQVRFLGEIPSGAAVRAELDKADMFVLPSRTEGLPRAMVEAMARGLPCIGTAVGGIVELLPAEDLVPAGDAAMLAAKIERCLRDPSRLQQMSLRNLAKAHEYREDILSARRTDFYRHLRKQTESWIEEGRRVA
jgi:glycosyltransferase involved in cell wall biosynthesis